MKTLTFADIDSSLGTIRLAATENGLCAVDFLDRWEQVAAKLTERFDGIFLERDADPHGGVTSLKRYLAGDLHALDDLPLDVDGTPFQKKVWAALRTIPVGTTLSYGALAEKIGTPGGSRAVGAANGQNPVAIVVPCHRVIGGDGTLCGYAGGVDRKRRLLAHEGALKGQAAFSFSMEEN